MEDVALKARIQEQVLKEERRRKQVQDERSLLIRENNEMQSLLDSERQKRRNLEEGRQIKTLALKKASAQLRKRIFFLKSLNEAVELHEIVGMIQEEARKTRGLGEALMVLLKGNQARVFYSSGRLTLEKKLNLAAEDVTSIHWRQKLADHLKRPIGPLIQLEGMRSQLLLFFEHQLPQAALKEAIGEWRLRMVGLELVVHRFQLAQDLREAALFWEKTFDGLDEPIGIFDRENQMIRANQIFTAELMAHLNESVVRDGSRVFHVESYEILMDRDIAEGSKVVHLTDQTASFQLKQHMIQTEKIAALGQLAGHIAHELNNPLTGIRSLCQLLQTDSRLEDQVRADISEVENAAGRCQNIIRNLLEYSKPHGEDQRVPTDVNEVINNTLPLLKSLMGKHRSAIRLSDKPMRALADPHMLQQVIFNLVTNACHAMEGQKSGEVTVETRREGKRIKIRIQDTGPGVPREILHEIFEPFFTTKPIGKGTGLGLSLSLSVIRGFGGEIRVDEGYADGAAFEITLPMVE